VGHLITVKRSSLFASCWVSWLVVSDHQHNTKNKPIRLLTLLVFDSCYMFRSTFGTIFKQFHQIHLLLLNCSYMDP
jgi:hypothetical protein